MKIVQINTVYGNGSTGKICKSISNLLTDKGIENYILYSLGRSENPNTIACSTKWYTKTQALKSRVLGNYGFNSKWETRKMIAHLERINPDVIHIHNIHGHDCHLGMLFRYLRKKEIKVFWTFHDCWAFTASCPHFTMAKCDQWKTECRNCPQIRQTSWFVDRSSTLYRRKKELFSGLDLTIITPSQWLADLVKESFLKEYPVRVIHNGIDLSIFKPTESDFREKYGIGDRHIVLGVAFGWGQRKGLDVFIELAKRLDAKYQIVLVGTDDKVDKLLPDNIISIHRTQNQKELAEIYTAADVFVNPTREENYPTVNMEAIACETPVITFDTGGSKEIICVNTGIVVPTGDIDRLETEIICTCNFGFDKTIMRKNAIKFDEKNRYEEYVMLYE